MSFLLDSSRIVLVRSDTALSERVTMPRDPFYDTFIDRDGKVAARSLLGHEVCDFCLTPHPTWEYPAALMEVVGHAVITHSNDEWGACDRCHAFIEAKNLQGLMRYAVRQQRKLYPPGSAHGGAIAYRSLRESERLMMRNILRFMDARTGPAVPYRPANA